MKLMLLVILVTIITWRVWRKLYRSLKLARKSNAWFISQRTYQAYWRA